MFYWGIGIGIFIGTCIGVVTMALCYMSRLAEEASKRDQGFAEMHRRNYGKYDDERTHLTQKPT